jgi:hypothetical protein
VTSYFFLISAIKLGMPIVSIEISKQSITQSNLVSTNPESLSMMNMIEAIF